MIYYNNRTPPDRTFSLGMPPQPDPPLRQQLAGTRPGPLLALCVALLFAQLGQASHLHAPQGLGHDFDDDHCSFWRSSTGHAGAGPLPTSRCRRRHSPRAATPARREPSRPPLRYDVADPDADSSRVPWHATQERPASLLPRRQGSPVCMENPHVDPQCWPRRCCSPASRPSCRTRRTPRRLTQPQRTALRRPTTTRRCRKSSSPLAAAQPAARQRAAGQRAGGRRAWRATRREPRRDAAHEPGVSSSYYGPVASRPIIRGLTGYRVQMLEDGLPSMDVSSVSDDHAVTSSRSWRARSRCCAVPRRCSTAAAAPAAWSAWSG